MADDPSSGLGRGGTPPPKSPKKRKRATPANGRRMRETTVRARWILGVLQTDRRITYGESCQLIRDQFNIGIVAAQQVHARALEIEREVLANTSFERLVAEWWRIYELAVEAKRYAVARSILDSMADRAGLSKPAKIEHSGKITVDQIAHLGVLALTPTQRATRLRILEAREALPPPDEDDASQIVDVDDAAAGDAMFDGLDEPAPETNGHNGHG